jgi:hypothetical protein
MADMAHRRLALHAHSIAVTAAAFAAARLRPPVDDAPMAVVVWQVVVAAGPLRD